MDPVYHQYEITGVLFVDNVNTMTWKINYLFLIKSLCHGGLSSLAEPRVTGPGRERRGITIMWNYEEENTKSTIILAGLVINCSTGAIWLTTSVARYNSRAGFAAGFLFSILIRILIEIRF